MTRNHIRALQLVALTAGLVLLGNWALATLQQREYQRRAAAVLEQSVDSAKVASTPRARHRSRQSYKAQRTRAQVRATGVVGRLDIPRLGVSGMIAEGVSTKTLARAIGHFPGTAYPGERGTIGLAGHRDSFFRGLRHVRRGDRIRLRTADGAYTYRVTRMRVVSPRETQVLADRGRQSLTLVTCYPFDYVGHAPNRWIVQADRVRARSPAVAQAPNRKMAKPSRANDASVGPRDVVADAATAGR